MKRVLVIHSKPENYYSPLYRALSKCRELDVTVLYSTKVGFGRPAIHAVPSHARYSDDSSVLQGYNFDFLPLASRTRSVDGLFRSLNPTIAAWLLRKRYDVVWIHGYNVGTNVLAFLVQRILLRRPVLLRDDQHLLNPRPAWKQSLKRRLLRPFFSRSIGLYVGTLNREWLMNFGTKPDCTFHVPHCVDNKMLRNAAASLETLSEPISRELGLDAAKGPIILAAGRMVWEKDFATLIHAFSQVRKKLPCTLFLVGDGPERYSLEQAVISATTPDVVFAGALDLEGMVQAYCLADVFVLPSVSETWGLVVNEAMNFALPIIVSDKVGCSVDLVVPGENGYIFPSGDARSLSSYLEKLVLSPDLRSTMGKASANRIQEWNYSRAVDGVISALKSIGTL